MTLVCTLLYCWWVKNISLCSQTGTLCVQYKLKGRSHRCSELQYNKYKDQCTVQSLWSDLISGWFNNKELLLSKQQQTQRWINLSLSLFCLLQCFSKYGAGPTGGKRRHDNLNCVLFNVINFWLIIIHCELVGNDQKSLRTTCLNQVGDFLTP